MRKMRVRGDSKEFTPRDIASDGRVAKGARIREKSDDNLPLGD